MCEGGSSGDFGVLFGYLWDVKIGSPRWFTDCTGAIRGSPRLEMKWPHDRFGNFR